MTISSLDSSSTSQQVQTPSSARLQKAALDTSILESSAASMQAKDEPLSLVFRAAIDNINELLEAELGPNAIEAAADAGLDTSPEATAERIVSLSTAFYGAFQEQNPDLNDEDALAQFMSTIGEGIDRGFAEARTILEGLKVLEGEIAANIDSTYALVAEGLTAFEERMRGTETQA